MGGCGGCKGAKSNVFGRSGDGIRGSIPRNPFSFVGLERRVNQPVVVIGLRRENV